MAVDIDGLTNQRQFCPENQDLLNHPPTPHRTFAVRIPGKGMVDVEEFMMAGEIKDDDGTKKKSWKLFLVKAGMLTKVIDNDGRQAPLFHTLIFTPPELDKAREDLTKEFERYYLSDHKTVLDYNAAVFRGELK